MAEAVSPHRVPRFGLGEAASKMMLT
jgi:hypothetical protein